MEHLGDHSLTVALFDKFPIRRTWHNDEWFYSLVDIVAALAATASPKRYWSDLKRKMIMKEGVDEYDFIVPISLPGTDGRKQKTDCANREGVLRVIQSILSPNAEPFKRWLAQVGNLVMAEAEETNVERSIRAQHRLRLHELDTALHEIVEFSGITTPAQHQRLTDANYAGLYSVATKNDVIRIRHLPFASEPEEFMGVMEMAAHIFQRASVASLVHQRNLQGEDPIAATAEDVGVQMRIMLEKMGMPMPENLPIHRRLSDGEWLPQELRNDTIDWDEELAEADDRIYPIYEIVDADSGVGKDLKLLEERHLHGEDD